jgi:uncharacterized protein YndB with AHSA1/START domain
MVAMAGSATATVTLPTDAQILITREFDAPKHLVYRAWTTPELVQRWWAGKQGEVTNVEIDLRVGGSWRYVMRAPDGSEVAFHGTFREIVPDERIVTTEVFEMPGAAEDDAPVTTTTFVERDGRTTLTMLVECSSTELRDAIVGSGMESGMQEAWAELERVAVSLANGR